LNSVLSQQLSSNSFSFGQSKGTTRGLLALAYQRKDIVFRSIIEFSSFHGLSSPLVTICLFFFFNTRICERWYFGLC
jgi:hypothetical protein